MSHTPITRAERIQGRAARALGRLPARVQLRLSGRPQVEVDGQRLEPSPQLILALNRKRVCFGLCEPDPAPARERSQREILIFGGPKTRVGQVRALESEGEAGRLRARHYAPTTDSQDLLVYLHGGGFVIGDLETHDETCRLLCLHARTHVLSVEYRLAPQHPLPPRRPRPPALPAGSGRPPEPPSPAGLHDAVSALRWAQANAGQFGAHASKVSIGGDSAGGHPAAVAHQL